MPGSENYMVYIYGGPLVKDWWPVVDWDNSQWPKRLSLEEARAFKIPDDELGYILPWERIKGSRALPEVRALSKEVLNGKTS